MARWLFASRPLAAALLLAALLTPAARSADTRDAASRRVLAIYHTGYSNPHASGSYGRWASDDHDPARLDGRGLPDSATARHPRLGMYDSRNPLIVREHMREAASAGIDGFVVPWRRDDRAADEALEVLTRAAEESGSFRVTARYDGPVGVGWERAADDIGGLARERLGGEGIVRSGGATVVFVSREALDAIDADGWRHVTEKLNLAGRAVHLLGEDGERAVLREFGLPTPHGLWPILPPRWVSLAPWYAPCDRLACAVVSASIAGSAANSRESDDRLRRAFYAEQWSAALGGDPDWVIIDSWNGWRDGTEIEPSLEHDDEYLRLTREHSAAFKEGRYLSVEPSRVLMSVGDEVDVRVTARNDSRDGRKGWVSLRAAGDDRFAPAVTPPTVSLLLPPHSEQTARFGLTATRDIQLGPAELRARARFGRQEPVEARVLVDVARPFMARLLPVTAPWFDEAEGPVVIVANRRMAETACTVTLTAPDQAALTQTVTLGPRASELVPFPQPGGMGALMPDRVWVTIAGAGRVVQRDLPVDWNVTPRTQRRIAVDGDLSDWPFRALFHLTEDQQVVGIEGWTRDDLSARACTAWDEDFFYLGVEVTDDEHVQTETGELMWTGDCVQFGVDALADRSRAYDENDYEYGLTLSPEGPVVWRWHGATYRRTGEVRSADLAVTRRDGKTVYELALPWRELYPLEPKTDAAFGFTLVVNDADETKLGKNVRDGAIQYTPGIIHGKDPSQFARWRLIGPFDGDGG